MNIRSLITDRVKGDSIYYTSRNPGLHSFLPWSTSIFQGVASNFHKIQFEIRKINFHKIFLTNCKLLDHWTDMGNIIIKKKRKVLHTNVEQKFVIF